ncbi:MAG: 3'-5' exonuclease [Verrucomicrobia bacterium]|nr:3'-5' exonuclease [Verrucomicrobiota bacterium]
MRAIEADITIIDFESTGVVDHLPDEPWQIGVVRFRGGRVLTSETFTSLLRVGTRPFSRHAPGRHASQREAISCAPTLESLWPELQTWVAGPFLVAHNASTEKRFLNRAYPMHTPVGWIDTLKLVRIAYPDWPSHKLERVTERLQLNARAEALLPDRAPHDALYDAVACGLLLESLLALPAWRDVSVAALVAARPDAFHKLKQSR